MKKGLLLVMMSMVMGGLVASPKAAVKAKAELEPCETPNVVYTGEWGENEGFQENGDLIYPALYMNTPYRDGKWISDFVSLEIAFFPTSDGFNEEKTYATVTHAVRNTATSSSITSALKGILADSDYYSPAFRYIRNDKMPEYEFGDSDWYVKDDISYYYSIDYRLQIKYDGNNDWTVEDSGRLKWAWEIFTNHPEKTEINYMEVLVYDDTVTEENYKSVKPLTTFKVDHIKNGDQFTYKADIENYLTLANLKKGKYKFSARLIPNPGSKFEPSDLYPLVGNDNVVYEPEDLSAFNIVKGAAVRASSDGGNSYRADEATDGNPGSQWASIGGGDTAWLLIDLGAKYHLETVKITWANDYTKDYDVFLAKTLDFENFDGDTNGMKAIRSVHDRLEYVKEDEFSVTGNSGRYLIISCLSKTNGGNYAIWEVEAFPNTNLTDAEKFIDDWKDLRASANGNICDVMNSDEMERLLAWYDELSDEDRAVVDGTYDYHGVTIAHTVEYVKASRALESNPATLANNLLLSTVVNNTNSIIALVAFVGAAMATAAYYVICKKKYNN